MMNADEKKCPRCAETIKAQAYVCRFCNLNFSAWPKAAGGAPRKGGAKWPIAIIVTIVVVVMGLSLSGGNRDETAAAPVTNELTSSAVEAGAPALKPHLPVEEYDAMVAIEELAGFHDTGFPYGRQPDSFSGGEIVHRVYKNGMLDLFTLPDGGLWRVNATSGIADRCGHAFSKRETVKAFLASIEPSAANDNAVIDKLFSAIRTGTLDDAIVGSIRFTARGDCLQALTATQQAALPN